LGRFPHLAEGILFAEKTSGTEDLRIYFKLYERTSGDVENLIGTSMYSSEVDTLDNYIAALLLDEDYDLGAGSRLVLKLYADVSGSGNAPEITIHCGTDYLSFIQAPTNLEILETIFVPYSGAASNVDLGGHDLTAGNLLLDGLGGYIGPENDTDLLKLANGKLYVYGNIIPTGTVDNRNVYEDGVKLDGFDTSDITQLHDWLTGTELTSGTAKLSRALWLKGADDSDFYISDDYETPWFHLYPDASGNIYCDASVGDLHFSSAGDVYVDDNIIMNSGKTVDGRDVSADGAVIDGLGTISTYDGDQNLATTDSPTFAGANITGLLNLDAQLDLDYIYDDSPGMADGLNVLIKKTSTQTVNFGNQRGLAFQSIFEPNTDWAGTPSIYGCYGEATVARDNCTGTVLVLGGYYGICKTTEITDGGAITVSAAYDYYAAQIQKNADDTITNAYGLYIADQTVGTTNYAIYTAGDANSYFGGDITAASYSDHTPAWKGSSKEALTALLAIKKDSKGNIDHTSLPEFARRTAIEQRPTGKKIVINPDEENPIEVDETEPVAVPARDLGAMVTLLTEAIKEQQNQINELKARIAVLEKKN